MCALPQLAVRGERGIRMRGDLRLQGRLVGGTDQPGPPRTPASAVASGQEALAAPALNRGWIDQEHGGDVTHAMPTIHGGQGSFTDVVGGVRALHRPTLADTHLL